MALTGAILPIFLHMPISTIDHSEELDDIISTQPHWFIRMGTGLFLVLLVALLALSWLIKFPTVVKCNLTMTSVNAPKSVLVNTPSRLGALLVHEQEHVQKGQALAFLENAADNAQVLRLELHLDSLARRTAAASLRTMSKPAYFPAQLGELQAKYQVFARAYSALYSLRAGGFFAKKERLLNAELATLRKGENNLTQQADLYRSDWALAHHELLVQQTLARKGVIATSDLRREQSRELAKQFPVKQAESARLQNLSAQRAKEQELLDLAKLEQEQTDTYMQSLNTLRSAVDEWKSKYVLVAPDSGRVNFSGGLEANQVVRANQELFFVSKPSVAYYGEMMVPQQNLGKVKVGQQVLIKLDGYPFNEYGLVNGRIAQLSEIPTAQNTFLAKVFLPDGLLTTYGKKIVFRNRISAQADILTEDTRLLERILYQIRLSLKSLG